MTSPLIASHRPLFGQSMLDKPTDLALMEKFAQPAAIERWLEEMVQSGVTTLTVPLDERILSILRRRRDLAIEIIPITPNVNGLVREATEYGMMGAGFRLVRRLGFGTMIRLGIHALPKAHLVLRKHFPTMLSVLFDLELSLFRTFKPRRVLLHPQICDLILAMGNSAFFEQYAKMLRARFGVEPGVCSNNFGTLANSFHRWGTPLSLVMTPVNEEGWLMKPTPEAVRAQLNNSEWTILADRPILSPPPTHEHIEQALRWNAVTQVVVDVENWKEFKI